MKAVINFIKPVDFRLTSLRLSTVVIFDKSKKVFYSMARRNNLESEFERRSQ